MIIYDDKGRVGQKLNYEDDVYTDKRKGMPNVGDEVKTENGKGTVIALDILNRSYTALVNGEEKVTVFLEKTYESSK